MTDSTNPYDRETAPLESTSSPNAAAPRTKKRRALAIAGVAAVVSFLVGGTAGYAVGDATSSTSTSQGPGGRNGMGTPPQGMPGSNESSDQSGGSTDSGTTSSDSTTSTI